MDRIPTRFETFDERFRGCNGDDWVIPIFSDGRWTEGPAWFPAHRVLVFSDIPNDRLMRYDDAIGTVSTFRQPANFTNGNLMDRRGRLVTCEQGGRRITRTEPDGTLTVLAERWQGQRFNSPDVIVEHSNGSLWFSDPSYGIDSNYAGIRAVRDLDRCMVFVTTPKRERWTASSTTSACPTGWRSPPTNRTHLSSTAT